MMDSFVNSESLAINSAHEHGVESCQHIVGETLSEETYCSEHLNMNISGNSCDCAGYFEMPECVMDIYLLALDGGDDSNAGLRQISDVYGPKIEGAEIDSNCNHNPAAGPNSGCACIGNGATASPLCDCEAINPYEDGFKDKKREGVCENCEYDTYQKGRTNKKPIIPGDDYNSYTHLVFNQFIQSSGGEDAYQQPLVNKKPHSADIYMIPNRSYRQHNNNNIQSADSEQNLTLSPLRQSVNNIRPFPYSYFTPDATTPVPAHRRLDGSSQTTVLYNSYRGSHASVDISFDCTKARNYN